VTTDLLREAHHDATSPDPRRRPDLPGPTVTAGATPGSDAEKALQAAHSGRRRTPPAGVTVYYDGNCGFCIWSVAVLLRLDRARRVRPAAIQDRVDTDLAGIPAERVLTSFHARSAGAPPVSAGAALTLLLSTIGPLRPLSRLSAAAPRATERAYFWVADRRGRWARLIPERFKRNARAAVAARSDR
jgi:predicted DCC family thiol-disulfide oxidoreductase YuxK